MRPKRYGSKAEKQAAYRARKAGKPELVPVLEVVELEWDRGKYPVHAAWVIALERVERARKYAAMFPRMIGPSDMCFQTVDWQYENEGLPAVRKMAA